MRRSSSEDSEREEGLWRPSAASIASMPGVDTSEARHSQEQLATHFDAAVDLEELEGPVYRSVGVQQPCGGFGLGMGIVLSLWLSTVYNDAIIEVDGEDVSVGWKHLQQCLFKTATVPLDADIWRNPTSALLSLRTSLRAKSWSFPKSMWPTRSARS